MNRPGQDNVQEQLLRIDFKTNPPADIIHLTDGTKKMQFVSFIRRMMEQRRVCPADTRRRTEPTIPPAVEKVEGRPNPSEETMKRMEHTNPLASPESADLLSSSLLEMFPRVEEGEVRRLLVKNQYDEEQTVEELLTQEALKDKEESEAGSEKAKVLVPECPVCLDPPLYPERIFQCGEGHILCGTCRRNITTSQCPTCRAPLLGRAIVLEQLIHSLQNTENILSQ